MARRSTSPSTSISWSLRRPRSRASSTFAEERGWRRLRLLSSAANTYNRDYLGETAEGAQRPMLNVFHRDGDGDPPLLGLGAALRADRSRTGSRAMSAPLEPVWNLFDLTPEGRGTDWDEQLSYS